MNSNKTAAVEEGDRSEYRDDYYQALFSKLYLLSNAFYVNGVIQGIYECELKVRILLLIIYTFLDMCFCIRSLSSFQQNAVVYVVYL